MAWQSKYSQLGKFLAANGATVIEMSFAEVATLLPDGLPEAAYGYRTWWTSRAGNSAQSRHGWASAGYRVSHVDLTKGSVTFTRLLLTGKNLER